MVRLARSDVLEPNEVAIADVSHGTVREYFLLSVDMFSVKNCDHLKVWIEESLLKLLSSHPSRSLEVVAT